MFAWLKIKLAVIGIAASSLILGLFYFIGRNHQRDVTKIDNLENEVEAIRRSEEIEDEVFDFNVDHLDDALAKWMRDKPK